MKMLQPKELEDSHKDLTWYANSKNLFMGSKKLLELVLRCYLIFLYCSVGFVVSKTDFSLFIYQEKEVRIYMLIYVDELLIYGNDIYVYGCYYNSSNQQGVFYRGIPNIYRGKKLGFLVLKP